MGRDLPSAEMSVNEFFRGKRILVTGVGSGIGRALAKALSDLGAEVHGMSKTASRLDSLRAECPSVKTICVDLTDFGKLRAVMEALPVMDGVVNNAGVGMHAPFLEATEEQFDDTFDASKAGMDMMTKVMALELGKHNIRV